MNKAVIIALLTASVGLLTLFTITSNQNKPVGYNMCDKRWATVIFSKGVNQCETGPQDIGWVFGQHTTLIADWAASNGISCNGVTPCTPDGILKDPKLTDNIAMRKEFHVEVTSVYDWEPALAALNSGAQGIFHFEHVGLFFIYEKASNSSVRGFDPSGQAVELNSTNFFKADIYRRENTRFLWSNQH
jgi:hypothetical protein